MKIVRPRLGLPVLGLTLLGLALAAAPASAQEAIRTGDGGAPPVTPADGAAGTQTESDAAWAHRVLNAAEADARAAQPDAKALPTDAKASAKCAAPPDRKPHGEVWAGVGSRGYRDVGGVVTQPLGSCGSVTLMIDHAQGGYGYRTGKAR